MAPNIITILIIISILHVTMKYPMLIQGQQQVPCLFFMGDSFFDNGNNNFLLTKARADYLPYGIDYPDGPTGRFTNGRNIPDFLAEFLGFDKPIPPFATAKGPEILKGVNYASGAAGILDDTGRQQGDRISLSKQLINHGITVFKIGLLLRNVTEAKEHLKKGLYIIDVGTNDYVNNYLLPQYYQTSYFFTPEKFAAILIKKYSQQLRTFYNYGARKIVIFGVDQVGCAPQILSMNPTNGSGCVDSINKVVQPFNDMLKTLIDNLNSDLPEARFIFINITSISLGDPSAKGIKVSNAPCCVVSRSEGRCDFGQEPCTNRNEYYFWDNFHPTEIISRVGAAGAYNAASPSDAYPMDIRSLVQK